MFWEILIFTGIYICRGVILTMESGNIISMEGQRTLIWKDLKGI